MVDEAIFLCDRLERLISDAVAALQDNGNSSEALQLREIQGAIDQMERMGVSAPEELYQLANGLSEQTAHAHQTAEAAAKTIVAVRERTSAINEKIGCCNKYLRYYFRNSSNPSGTSKSSSSSREVRGFADPDVDAQAEAA
jgi:hypothetical protein